MYIDAARIKIYLKFGCTELPFDACDAILALERQLRCDSKVVFQDANRPSLPGPSASDGLRTGRSGGKCFLFALCIHYALLSLALGATKRNPRKPTILRTKDG